MISICLDKKHDLLVEMLRDADEGKRIAELVVRGLSQQLSDSQELCHAIRMEKDVQIAKLEVQVQDLRRESLRITDDILISFGVRHPPSGEGPQGGAPNHASTQLRPAEKFEDRQDDEDQGLNPIDWQKTAQALEWQSFKDTERQELEEYIALRKARAKGGRDVTQVDPVATGVAS